MLSALGVQIPTGVVFEPMGAVCGFVAFQNGAGNLLAFKIYKAFAEDDKCGFQASSARTVGFALSLDYLTQLSVAVLGGGYATGTAETVTHGPSSDSDTPSWFSTADRSMIDSKAGNKMILATIAVFWL